MLDTLLIIGLVLGVTFSALPFWKTEMPETGSLPASGPEEIKRAFIVVVDAGHGGIDGGAEGSKTGIAEAGLNLSIAKLVQEGLEAEGVIVLMTRTDENALDKGKKADMAARKAIMCEPGVDIVVSIHMNKFSDPSVKGPMAFYMQGNDEGQRLAEFVIAALCEAAERPIRRANPADYFIIRESPCPSILVECGFLSNPGDEALLQDPQHQRKLATGVVTGLMAYLNSLPDDTQNTAIPSPSITAPA